MKMSEKQTSEEKKKGREKQKWSRKMRDGKTLVAHRGDPVYKAPAVAATCVSCFHLKHARDKSIKKSLKETCCALSFSPRFLCM